MEKSWKLARGVVVFAGAAVIGCGAPDSGDDPAARRAADQATTETKRGALTTSLFQPFVVYPTGSFPEAVAIGDLDGDGRNDVALLTSTWSAEPANDYMVHVFLQDADGSLKPRVRYPVGARGRSIDIGDVNGDGRADVVVGLNGGTVTQIGVLLQNAAGTLDAMSPISTPNASQVKVGDFNGDGRMDLAGLSWGGTGLDVFLQTETGALAPPVTYAVPHGGYDELDAGDIDGDGRTDLVVMSGQGFGPNVNVLLQTADGAFGAPTSYSVGSNNLTGGVALGDTNADGRTDIVVSYGGNRPGSFIARFLQSAGGTMDPAVSYPSYDIPSAMSLADMDGDGRKDVVVLHDGWNRIGVYRQFPGGDFVNEELYTADTTDFNTQALAVGDIDGDGRPDAVNADATHGLVVLRHVHDTSLALAITSPAAGSQNYVGVPLTIRWTPGDIVAITGYDVSASFNNGSSYTPIDGCTGLPATARDCPWTPALVSPTAIVRVTARTEAGQTAFAENTINVAAPSITVTFPTSMQFIGTNSSINWSHNLPATGTVRIELSRDGGGSFETLTDAAPVGNGVGAFAWSVTGPATTTALVRVTANGSLPASGSSTTFAIGTPSVTVTAPTAGAMMYTNTTSPQVITWTTNVNTTSIRIELSRDGGVTFPTLLSPNASNTGKFNAVQVPGPSSTNAVIRVTANNGFVSAAGTSATFTLAQPTAAVTSPGAGAVLYAGAQTAITWSSNLPPTSLVTVDLSRDGGSSYTTLATNLPNTGTFVWVVTGPSAGAARVRVTVRGPVSASASSGTFAIVVPSLNVTSPGAGAAFYAGTPLAITWATNLPAASPVTVELSRDGGSSYEVLAANAPNTGNLAWIGTGPSTGTAVVRVTVGGPGSMSATSGAFAITVPSLAVTGPAAGASFYAGSPVTITWSTNLPAGSTALVELSRDGGSTFATLAAAAPNTGSFAWVAIGPDSAAVVARVTVTDPVAASGTSGAFAITTPSLTVTGPATGTVAYAGTPVTVTWTHNLPDVDPVTIELSRDDGATFTILQAAAPNTGSFVWTASGPDTAAARVRVTSTGAVPAGGVGPAFQIVTPALAVTSPAAGANWAIGTARTISWSSSNLPAGTTVLVELSGDGGASWTTLASAATGGSLAWTATGPATSAAVVRVSANGGVPAVATSAGFTIGNPSVTVTSPVASASWTIGLAQTITWTSNLLSSATVKIELTRNGGSTYTTLASSAPNTGSFAWTATGPSTTNAFIRVSANGFTASGLSGRFSLASASVRVTSPNTFVTWTVGTVHAITWTHNLGASAQFKIEVSRSGIWSTITSAVTGGGATSGSYNWTVTSPRTSNARIRVTWTAGTTVTDTSDVSFTIN